jgi:hypothetical protein
VYHEEAVGWADRIRSAGGMALPDRVVKVVSALCRRMDATGLRQYFYRLNLLIGLDLVSSLTPLYLGPVYGGTTYGGATDTNVASNFTAADFSLAAGGKGNGTSKSLKTELPTNVSGIGDAQYLHFGTGVLATDTRTPGLYASLGTYRGGWHDLTLCLCRTGARPHVSFGESDTTTAAGVMADTVAIRAGNHMCAWPHAYYNGVQYGVSATLGDSLASGDSFFVFSTAINNSPSSWTDARLGWYSIGLTMPASAVYEFERIIRAFYFAIGRA